MASIRDFWLGYGGEHRSGGDLTVFRSGMPDVGEYRLMQLPEGLSA